MLSNVLMQSITSAAADALDSMLAAAWSTSKFLNVAFSNGNLTATANSVGNFSRMIFDTAVINPIYVELQLSSFNYTGNMFGLCPFGSAFSNDQNAPGNAVAVSSDAFTGVGGIVFNPTTKQYKFYKNDVASGRGIMATLTDPRPFVSGGSDITVSVATIKKTLSYPKVNFWASGKSRQNISTATWTAGASGTTYSNGNLTVTANTGGSYSIVGINTNCTGLVYAEITASGFDGDKISVGFCPSGSTLPTTSSIAPAGSAWYVEPGIASAQAVYGLAMDVLAGKWVIQKNGVTVASGYTAYFAENHKIYFAGGKYTTASVATLNVGATAFVYSMPAL